MTCDMWFGTQERAGWIQTPQTGADVSPGAWGESGVFLDGGAYAFNSYNSHKRYVFNWRTTSSKAEAQKMMSYYSGTFGRGKLYFQDPLTYDTNVLPARWADPSITCEFEGDSLIPGVEPVSVAASSDPELNLPVRSARYDLSGVSPDPAFTEETVVTNYFTNPRLVGDGTWAEVRRNLLRVPKLTQANGTGATLTDETAGGVPGGVIKGPFTNASTAAASTGGVQDGTFVSAQVAIETRNASSVGQKVTVRVYGGAGFFDPGALEVTLPPMGQRLVVDVPPVVPATVATGLNPRVFFYPVGPAPATTEFWAGGLMLESVGSAGKTTGPYFNDTTSPDPDFRPRALPTGEAVLEGERVRGVTALNGEAVRSSVGGKPAMRVVALSPISKAYVRWDIPNNPARSGGVMRSTLHISAPLNPAPTGASLKIYAGVPNQQSPTAPNVPGTHAQEAEYENLTSTYRLYWYSGHYQGDADVRYTDIGLYNRGYTGGYFTGESGELEYEGASLETRWSGAVDNSSSVAVRVTTTSTPKLKPGGSVFIPVPDGFQLSLGGWFTATGACGVFASAASATGVTTRTIQVASSQGQLEFETVTKNPGETGFYLYFAKTASGAANLTVNALHARLSRIGDPVGGENYWIGGQGNEGVRFEGPPTYINHTGRDGGQVEFAATFVESVM